MSGYSEREEKNKERTTIDASKNKSTEERGLGVHHIRSAESEKIFGDLTRNRRRKGKNKVEDVLPGIRPCVSSPLPNKSQRKRKGENNNNKNKGVRQRRERQSGQEDWGKKCRALLKNNIKWNQYQYRDRLTACCSPTSCGP